MIKRKLIFRSIQCVLLVWLAGMLPIGCQDDWDTYGEGSSGQKVTINLKLPVALASTTDPEMEITDAHFYAYGSDDTPIAYSHITGTTSQQILIPVGKCDIYIVANDRYTGGLGLPTPTTPRSELEKRTYTGESVTDQPFVMLGVYKGVNITSGGKIMYGVTDITQKIKLQSIAAKVTIKLTSDQGAVTINSVSVNKKAKACFLMPGKEYALNTYENEAHTPNLDTCSFYLPEYIVNESHKVHSSYAVVNARVGDGDNKDYKIYIGDYFGYSPKYHEWNWAAMPMVSDAPNPSAVSLISDSDVKIGLDGLNVTRNKHYILKGKIAGGPVDVSLKGTVEVKDWILVDIPTDILPTASLSLSETDIIVSAIKDSVPVLYQTTLEDIKVEIDSTQNKVGMPNSTPRFTYSIDKNKKMVSFTHSTEATTYESDGAPIVVPATITAFQGTEYSVKKKVNLIAFNPVAKNHLDNAGDWLEAMGYWEVMGQNPYSLNYNNLSGKYPSLTYMDNAPPNAPNRGCPSYYEGDKNNPQTGAGSWKLPTKEEAVRMQKIVKAMGASYGSVERIWSSSEYTTDSETSTEAYVIENDTEPPYTQTKSSIHNYYRCVRSKFQYAAGDKASYLQVSHRYYEVALGEYPGNLFSTIPITYESDKPVSIRLLDSYGTDLSSLAPENMIDPYFIGFSVKSDADLKGDISELYFPKKLARLTGSGGTYHISGMSQTVGIADKKKGKFYLFPNVQPMEEIARVLSPYSCLPPQVNRMLYNLNGNNEFTLLFSAGVNLTSTVRIRVVNPVAQRDYGAKMKYGEAAGISDSYIGYSVTDDAAYPPRLKPNKYELPYNVRDSTISATLVPNVASGCAEYFEGAPGDPDTGKGNWYLADAFPDILARYVKDRTAINSGGGLKGETSEGSEYDETYKDNPTGYWRKYLGMDNLHMTDASDMYWSTADSIGQSWGYRLNNRGIDRGRYTKTQSVGRVRCIRKIGADALDVPSILELKSKAFETVYLPYSTSTPLGIEAAVYYLNSASVGNLEVTVNGNTQTVANTGIIVITMKNPQIGDIANIVLKTKDKNRQTIRIMKVKGIN